MRAFLFLIVLLSTYYIAAVFRSAALLVLCLAEGAALAVMLVSVWILRRNLRVSLGERSGEAVRGAERACTVRMENPTVLPAARVELRLASRWLWEGRDGVLFLYGGAEHGEARLTFQLRAAHCGILFLRLEQVRVYDWLCLFHASRKTGEELCLAVYPEAVPLRIRLTGSDWDGGSRSTDRSGDDSGEALKIREYQPGDPLRRVHWNQSARTDRLWMKEFPREADRLVHVLAEPGQWDNPSGQWGNPSGQWGNPSGQWGNPSGQWDNPWAADGFWQVLYSLSLGLLDTVSTVRFHWLDGGTGGTVDTSGNAVPRSFDAADVEQVRELLLTLYRSFPPNVPEQEAPVKRGKPKKRRAGNLRAEKRRAEKRRAERRRAEKRRAEKWRAGKQAGEAPSDRFQPPDPRLLERIPPGDRFLRLTGDLRLYAEGAEVIRFSAKGLTEQIRAARLEL